ncbi:hypothetical protein QJQ45_013858 [Haematococcus lacustris]|nr:hypothetical protein QJQ45_013858 [Haematococcus lacustris]
MSHTVERPDRPAAEVAAAHDDAPSRTLLGSASTFTARLLESAKARAELLQSQAQVTMAAASERIRGKSDPTLAPEADQAEISAGGQEAGAAQSAPHKSASALASTVMAAAADLSRKTREGSSAAYQAALEGIRRLTAPSRRIARRHPPSQVPPKIVQQDIYALILDFTSAFKTTDQDKTLWIMYDLGFTTNAFEVVKDINTGACTTVQLTPQPKEAWDSMLTTMMKRRFGLWVSAPSAMIREDTDNFGLGCTSLAVEYNSRCVKAALKRLHAQGRYSKPNERPGCEDDTRECPFCAPLAPLEKEARRAAAIEESSEALAMLIHHKDLCGHMEEYKTEMDGDVNDDLTRQCMGARVYIVRPNPRTLAAIDRARERSFSQADRRTLESESWVSVYVRRGDKAKESSEMLKDPKPFLDRATQIIRDNPGTVAPRIFLATEDVGVHSYFLANASVPVFAANVMRYNEDIGYSPMDHARRIGPDVEFINALMSLEITMTGDAFVFAMVSNWGRLINEMRSTVQCKADSDFFDPEQPNGITRLNWR